MEQFDNHVKKMHSDRDQHFEDEYAVSQIINLFSFFSEANNYICGQQSISKEPQNSYAASEILVNKLRNRFGNIFPCKYLSELSY